MHLVTRAYALVGYYPEDGKTCFNETSDSRVPTVTQLIEALDCNIGPLPHNETGIYRESGGVYTVWPRVPNRTYNLYIIPDSDDPESFIWFHHSMIDAYLMHLELAGIYNTPERVAALLALGFIENPDAAIQSQGVGT